MKKKFTPGPWKVDNDGDRGYVVESEKVKPIASRIEKVQDARLLAAAPYLLEALEELCKIPLNKIGHDDRTSHVFMLAQQALKKVRG